VFQAVTVPSLAWVNVASECGYYDQAHLIRDFRDFSGEPPAALLTAETDLAFHFLQSRPMSHLSKTLSSVSA
jgi:AraC-like DNA-binding protein